MGRIVGFSNIGLLLIGVIAAAVLVYMVWPRRIALRPRCRGCGYSVDEYRPERCPECGADLDADDAVRVGPRFGFLPRLILVLLSCVVAIISSREFLQRRVDLWLTTAWNFKYYNADGRETYDIRPNDSDDSAYLHFQVEYPRQKSMRYKDGWLLTQGLDHGGGLIEFSIDRMLSGTQTRLAQWVGSMEEVNEVILEDLIDTAGIQQDLEVIQRVLGSDETSRDAIITRLLHHAHVAVQQDPAGALQSQTIPSASGEDDQFRVQVHGVFSLGKVSQRSDPLWWHRFLGRGWTAVILLLACGMFSGALIVEHTKRSKRVILYKHERRAMV